jgi:hypothetical protein
MANELTTISHLEKILMDTLWASQSTDPVITTSSAGTKYSVSCAH